MLTDSDLDFEVYSICFVILIYIYHSKDSVYIIARINKRPIVHDTGHLEDKYIFVLFSKNLNFDKMLKYQLSENTHFIYCF